MIEWLIGFAVGAACAYACSWLVWRHVRAMIPILVERCDVQSGRADALSKRFDTIVEGHNIYAKRFVEHDIARNELLERTRLHRKLLDHTRARLDVHGRAIGVQCVFEDLPPMPEPEGTVALLDAMNRGRAAVGMPPLTDEQLEAAASRYPPRDGEVQP